MEVKEVRKESFAIMSPRPESSLDERYTREELIEKKSEVGNLQKEIETLKLKLANTREDYAECISKKAQMDLCFEQIQKFRLAEGQEQNDTQNQEVFQSKDLVKKKVIQTLQILFSNKNEEFKAKYENDLKIMMGSHSSMKELYTRCNMVILCIRLNCRKTSNIVNTVNILANFTNTIKDAILCSCRFWEIDSENYVLVDDKNVTIPKKLKIREIFFMNQGTHKLSFTLINKYMTQFEILKCHIKSIVSNVPIGSVTGVPGSHLISSSKGGHLRDSKGFKKHIIIEKLDQNRLETSLEKFFKKFPKMKDYVNILEIDNNKVKRKKELDTFHQRGPLAFITVFLIIVIQLIQLNHFDVAKMYNLRGSLLQLFLISPGKMKLNDVYYFSETTSRKDFKYWVTNMTSNVYYSQNRSKTPKNFFAEKCMFVGPPVLLKFVSKTGFDGNPALYYSNYNEKTMQTKDLYDSFDNKLFPWGKFKTKAELGLNYNLGGFISDYDEGGYPLEFGLETESLELMKNRIKKIDKFLTRNTLAANFILSGYILDIDYFFSLNLALEKTPSGGYQPIMKEVQVFRPGLRWNYMFNLAGDITVYLLSIMLGFIYFKTIIRKRRTSKLYKFCSKISFALTTMFMIVQIAYIYFNTVAIIKDNGRKILESKKFQDLRQAAWRFKTNLRLKAFNTGVAVLLMNVILNYKITQKFSVTILNVAIMKNIQYLLLILPIFLGLALVAGFILGPYNADYTDFTKALISVMLFTVGRISPGKTLKYQSLVGCVFISLLYIIALFLSFTIFISFGLQSYYAVMSKTGYYASSWHETSLKDFLRFALFFLPENYFDRGRKIKPAQSYVSFNPSADDNTKDVTNPASPLPAPPPALRPRQESRESALRSSRRMNSITKRVSNRGVVKQPPPKPRARRKTFVADDLAALENRSSFRPSK